jgi:hypothetical protein
MNKTAKQIRDEYNLRQSILNFQLIYIDQNNLAYPTNCLCQTESIREIEGLIFSDHFIKRLILYLLNFF